MFRNLLGASAALVLVSQASIARAADPAPSAPPSAAPAAVPAASAPAPAATPAAETMPALPLPTAPATGPESRTAPAATPAPAASSAPAAATAPSMDPEGSASDTRVYGSAPMLVAEPRAAVAVREVADEADDGLRGSHQLHFYAALGVRSSLIDDRGYQPFSSNTGLAQFSAMLGRVLFTDSALSFGLGAGWDYGITSARARGTPTELSIHRVTLIPEVRYHLIRRLYAFGRVGAGVAALEASYSDAIVGVDRTRSQASFTADPAVGLAFELFGAPSGGSRQPRLWLLADAGYLFTSKMDLVLTSESETPARTQPLDLGELALSGATFRGMAALTF